MSVVISGQLLTILLPWTEVEGSDILAFGVTSSSRAVLKGSFRYFSDTCVVTDNASQRGAPQGILLSISKYTIILPPQSEIGRFPKIVSICIIESVIKVKVQVTQTAPQNAFLVLTGLPGGYAGTEWKSGRQTKVQLLLHGQMALRLLQATHQCCQVLSRDPAVFWPGLGYSALDSTHSNFWAVTAHKTCAIGCSLKITCRINMLPDF